LAPLPTVCRFPLPISDVLPMSVQGLHRPVESLVDPASFNSIRNWHIHFLFVPPLKPLLAQGRHQRALVPSLESVQLPPILPFVHTPEEDPPCGSCIFIIPRASSTPCLALVFHPFPPLEFRFCFILFTPYCVP